MAGAYLVENTVKEQMMFVTCCLSWFQMPHTKYRILYKTLMDNEHRIVMANISTCAQTYPVKRSKSDTPINLDINATKHTVITKLLKLSRKILNIQG